LDLRDSRGIEWALFEVKGGVMNLRMIFEKLGIRTSFLGSLKFMGNE